MGCMEGDARVTDREIQDCLSLLSSIEERAEIDWKEQYRRLSNIAALCVKELCIFDYMRVLRRLGESKRSMSYEAVEQEAGERFDQLQAEAENGFYFPLSERETFEFLPKIMNPSFTFEPDVSFMISASLALKTTFYSLSQEGSIKPAVTIWLSIALTTLIDKVAELRYVFWKEDQQRVRNRQNASCTSPRIARIKKHPSYSKIREMLGKYTGDLGQRNKIDKILRDITGVSNEKTLRKYRTILIEDFKERTDLPKR